VTDERTGTDASGSLRVLQLFPFGEAQVWLRRLVAGLPPRVAPTIDESTIVEPHNRGHPRLPQSGSHRVPPRRRWLERSVEITPPASRSTCERATNTATGTGRSSPLAQDGLRVRAGKPRNTHEDGGCSRLFEISPIQKARQRQLRTVFNSTYQFTGLDPDGTVLEMNEAALSFGDLERDDVVRMAIWDTRTGSGPAKERAKRRSRESNAPGTGTCFGGEIRIQGTDRTIIDFSIRPVTDRNGEVTPHPRGERHHRPQTAQNNTRGSSIDCSDTTFETNST